MSWLGDFAGAAADSGAGIIGNQIKLDQQQESAKSMASFQSQLDQQKQAALLELQDKNAATLRGQRVSDINTQLASNANSIIGSKYATDALPATEAGTDTPMPQEAVDSYRAALATLDADKQKAVAGFVANPANAAMAEAQTGYSDYSKLAGMQNSAEMNQMKLDSLLARADDRNATMAQIAQIRSDAVRDSAQLRVDAANQRATTGKIDHATGRMLITSEDANIRAATTQMGMLNSQLDNMSPSTATKPNPDFDAAKSQLKELQASITASQENKNAYLRDMGLMSDKAATKAAPAAPAAPAQSPVPKGMSLVGHTPTGAPVYQDANGKRFTQ